MVKRRASLRTHSRSELAPARPPIALAIVVIGLALAAFAGISELIN